MSELRTEVSDGRRRKLKTLRGVALWWSAVLLLVVLGFAVPQARAAQPTFGGFVSGLWPQAHARGVSRATFDAAFAGISPDPTILAKTHRQAEFAKPLADYLASAVSDKRIATGRSKFRDFDSLLASIERRYGVDRYIVLGVWGMETNFGGFTGGTPVVQALATLAYARYRGDYFRRELIIALEILEARHVAVRDMTGSWAGAMGQTQFMPSSFLRYAVDFDGDGRKDIWTNVADALGSTANYLARHGWARDLIWGYEVEAPEGLASGDHYRPFSHWSAEGVRRADGQRMPDEGNAAFIRPGGTSGPAFLVTHNFKIIKSYNNSTSYALGVALLSDRIAGSGAAKSARLSRPAATGRATAKRPAVSKPLRRVASLEMRVAR